MPRKPISIRLSEDELAWLTRDGSKIADQLRMDAHLLRQLLHIADKQPGMTIAEAIDLAQAVWVEK